MKHSFALFCAVFVLMMGIVPSSAQTVSENRLALAHEMHQIWPIRTRMEDALDGIVKNFPEEKRAAILAAMRKSINYDLLEQESVKAMAEIFTEDELKAMVAFYSSDAGRSVSAKTNDYEEALRPVMTKMLDKAIMDAKMGAQP